MSTNGRRLVDPSRLATALEIANALGVTRQAIYEWSEGRDDFPDPVVRLGVNGKTRLWLLPEVQVWFSSRPDRERQIHGRSAYARGCRCSVCRAANAKAMQDYRAGKRRDSERAS